MANLSGFNASEVEPSAGFDALPAGKYLAVVAASEMKQTKAGNGEYLKLEVQIVDGQHKGRKIWHNLNLQNANATAVNIAKAELSALCRAVNVLTPNDSLELHDIPFCMTLGVQKNKETGELENRIKKFEPRAAMQAASQSSTPAAAGGQGGIPPWVKKAT